MCDNTDLKSYGLQIYTKQTKKNIHYLKKYIYIKKYKIKLNKQE